MKIVSKDNFNREHISEVLIAENVLRYYANYIVEALNKRYSGDYADTFFVATPDSYKLYKFNP